MIACRSCGAQFDAALVRCPYCGTAYAPAEENEYMGQLEDIRTDLESADIEGHKAPEQHYEMGSPHSDNMRQYDTAYTDTRRRVIGSALKTGGLAKRAAILVVLIIAAIIMSVISSMNYADPDPDAEVRRDSERNAAAYAQEAEAYLQRGEYTEYMSYLYAHELQNFPPSEFDHLKSVTYVASEYYDCIKYMEVIILRSDDPDYFDGLDTDIGIFVRGIDEFYEVYEVQRESKPGRDYIACMDEMKTELEAAMRTYFDMDEDELREFLSASEAQKGVILEEVLRHE